MSNFPLAFSAEWAMGQQKTYKYKIRPYNFYPSLFDMGQQNFKRNFEQIERDKKNRRYSTLMFSMNIR